MKITKNEKEKGITLMALVVTIILVLILAGISIAMLSGENGILKQSMQAKEETEYGQIQEEVSMDLYGGTNRPLQCQLL